MKLDERPAVGAVPNRTVETASPPKPVAARRPRSSVRRWLLAFLLGIAAVHVSRFAINRSRFPDKLVSPLFLSDTQGVADVIVVPGAAATGLCTPSLNSLRRVLLAVRLYREGRGRLVLFSGGASTGHPCAVADVMARTAREVGLPADVIRIENTSRSTWQNAERSLSILHALRASRILLVTDRLHMPRAQACFARFGFGIERASVPVPEGNRDNVDMLWMGGRELVATWYYRYQGWIGDPTAPLPQPAGRSVKPGASISDTTSSAMNQPLKNPNGPIVILGASYAGGWPLSTLAGVPVINKGVSGQQSFELLERFERDVVDQRPRAVILWGFINDVHRSSRAQMDQTLARARLSFTQMIERARQQGIEPIVATELTVRPPKTLTNTITGLIGRLLGKESYQDYVNAQVLSTNAWLRDLARREGLLLLDIQPVLSYASGERRKEYSNDDGSHLPPAGYEALTRYARPVIESRVHTP
jgi:uncharacterized SAM-binding protein YcdF (DUF218 family)/lysophospholipase L1-like esterase